MTMLAKGLSQSAQMEILGVCALMESLHYSKHTIRSYQCRLKSFFAFFSENDPRLISCVQVEAYIFQHVRSGEWSKAILQQVLNAIGFYYERVLHIKHEFTGLRPKIEQKLPKILSPEEIASIFRAVKNLKHRTILILMYSAGVALGELREIRRSDIYFDAGRINVRGINGNHDRQIALSEKMTVLLKEYCREYRCANRLFEGRSGEPFSERSVQVIFDRALRDAGFKKRVSIRVLRHSFAVHLIEQGIDIRYVQELMGHHSIKTTKIYARIARAKNRHFTNPLDYLEF